MAFFENLLKAQSEFVTLPKNSKAYGYNYTDLDTIVNAVKPILAKHGIGFTQLLEGNGIRTILFDKDGKQLEGVAELPVITSAKNNAAQTLGMSITYMRRYALCAILGITSDEDVDACTGDVAPSYNNRNNNNNNKTENKKSEPVKKVAPAPTMKGGDATPEEAADFRAIFESTYSDGSLVFTPADKHAYSAMRMDKTAREVISIAQAELRKRMKANTKAEYGNSENPVDIV